MTAAGPVIDCDAFIREMQARDVGIPALARACGMDVGNVYDILHHGQKPRVRTVHKLLDGLESFKVRRALDHPLLVHPLVQEDGSHRTSRAGRKVKPAAPTTDPTPSAT